MNFLEGKNIVWLGSSVTFGAMSDGYSMVEALEEKHPGLHCEKYAVSGTTLVNTDASSYVARMKEINRNIPPDIFIVQLSTNDASQGKPLGNLSEGRNKDDFDDTTIIGAIEYIIAYAKETWGCPVAFYTGTYFESEPYARMVQALTQIQEKWGIGVIDLWNNQDMTALYGTEEYNRYMADPVHPVREGYVSWWMPEFEEYLYEFFSK